MQRRTRALGWAVAAALVLGATSLAGAEEEQAKVIEDGSTVGIEYTLKLEDGTVADTSEGRAPLVYEQGAGKILPALEAELVGMSVGDEKKVNLSAEDGYGPVRDELYQTVQSEQIPADARTVGTTLMAQDAEGNQRPVRVHEVREESDEIVIDLNHPLAGKELLFEVKVVSIE